MGARDILNWLISILKGSSRNLGGPVVSVEVTGCGESGKQSPGPRMLRLCPRERSPRCSGGTARRRKRSNAGGAAGSRSASQCAL